MLKSGAAMAIWQKHTTWQTEQDTVFYSTQEIKAELSSVITEALTCVMTEPYDPSIGMLADLKHSESARKYRGVDERRYVPLWSRQSSLKTARNRTAIHGHNKELRRMVERDDLCTAWENLVFVASHVFSIKLWRQAVAVQSSPSIRHNRVPRLRRLSAPNQAIHIFERLLSVIMSPRHELSAIMNNVDCAAISAYMGNSSHRLLAPMTAVRKQRQLKSPQMNGLSQPAQVITQKPAGRSLLKPTDRPPHAYSGSGYSRRHRLHTGSLSAILAAVNGQRERTRSKVINISQLKKTRAHKKGITPAPRVKFASQ
jgi:hypothetical protein